MPDRVYLDWNATTPLRPEARQAMAAAWEVAGNPSSVHAEGRQARRLVEDARAAIAAAVGARPQDVVFTSGGTEANALALTPGLRRGAGEPVRRLLVSAIEHTSVLSGGRFSPEAIGTIQVTGSGLIDLDHLRRLLAVGQPALVSVMLANNETGALQPVGEVADIVHEAGGLLHVDAIQALGKIPFDIKSMKADLVTLSAHKIGGPKGVGALVLAEDMLGLEPLLRGGGQELGRRAGTENVAGIAAFGAAVRAAMAALEGDAARLRGLRDRLEAGLKQTPGYDRVLRGRAAAAQYHPVHRSRTQGRNGRHWLRSGRYCGILGLRLLVGQGPAIARPGRHGGRHGTGAGSGAAQSGLVYHGGRH